MNSHGGAKMLPQIQKQTEIVLVHRVPNILRYVVTDWGTLEANEKLRQRNSWENTFTLAPTFRSTLTGNEFELEIISIYGLIEPTYSAAFKLTATDLEESFGEDEYVKLSATSEFNLLRDFTPPPDADSINTTEAEYVKLSVTTSQLTSVDWTPPADTSLPATNSHELNYVKLTAGTPTGVTYTFHG